MNKGASDLYPEVQSDAWKTHIVPAEEERHGIEDASMVEQHHVILSIMLQ